MALAGFTVGEAEGLRRAMSRKRSRDAIEAYRQRFVDGAAAAGVDRETAEQRVREAARFRLVRVPEVACGRVRAARLPVGVASPPLPGRVPVRAPERPADGLLPAREPRPGRAAARAPRCAAPDVNASEAACTLEGEQRPDRARVHSRCSGRSRPGRSSRSGRRVGPFASVARPGAASAARSPRARGARRSPGPATAFGWPRRQLLWQLGLAPRPASAGAGGAARQLVLPLGPHPEMPELPEESAWERMLADYRTTALSVGPHPLALLRPHLPAERRLERRACSGAGTASGSPWRARRRAPAAGDGKRGRVHAARGRARAGQPRRAAARLRPLPRDDPRGAAAARPRALRG